MSAVRRAVRAMLDYRGGAAVAGVFTVILVALLTLAGVRSEESRYDEEARSELIRDGGRLRADLERTVDALVAGTEGLVGFATAQAAGSGGVDPELFAWYARELQAGSRTPFRRVQLAPEAVITHVYPLEGNEDLVGVELMADPDRRRVIEQAIRTRRTLVVGPVEVQGEVAIVARSPVFTPIKTGGDRFWGVATTLIGIDAFYEEAGLTNRPDDLDIALRGRDGLGADGAVFFGDAEVFAADPVRFEVALPSGTWELGVLPAGGWGVIDWPLRSLVLTGGFVLAVMLGALVWGLVASRDAVRVALLDRAELIETANSPIAQVTASGEVTVWNSRAEEVSGLESGSIVGTNIQDVGDRAGGLCGAIASLLEQTLRTGERIEGSEFEIEHSDGRRLLLVFNTSPIFDDRGRITDMVAIAQDLTARYETDRIRQENESMAEAARLKDEFLANMSHELRTPLNGIIGLSTLLGDGTVGELTSKQVEYVGHIHSSGQHLLSLINDILDMARLSSEDQQGQIEPVDVNEAVAAAVRRVQSAADEKSLPVRVESLTTAPVVLAHQGRLVQVLVKLLSNAIKFTEAGQVTVRTEQRDGEVHIAVSDTGIGIPADKMRLLFRPFTQVDGSLDRSFEGSGLGLALSQRLVTMLGGRIDVTSQEGEGSVFTLVFPTAEAAPFAAAMPVVSGAARIQSPRRVSRVLVAEDNLANRLVLTEFLTRKGYEVIEAADGFEALQAIRRDRPDAVLMDIQMPRMEGLRATSIIKADRETWDIPVIALTALAMDGDEARCLEAGCDAYLTKPVDLDEVARMLEGLIGRLPSDQGFVDSPGTGLTAAGDTPG